MDGRTWSRTAVLALALALPIAPVAATAASAHSGSVVRVAPHGSDDGPGHESGSGQDDRGKDRGKEDKQGKHKQKGKKARTKFNLGGRVTAVDVTAGTVTFRVHGGKFKALRKTELTVTVADGARVRHNDAAATLADFSVGDKVRAKGNKVDGVWTANRIKAESPGFHAEPGDDSGDDSPDDNGSAV